MPNYAFEAMNKSGEQVKDTVEAGSSEEAIALIRSKGLYPIKVKERAGKKKVAKKEEEGGTKSAKPAGKMSFTFGRVPLKQTTAFTRQLATLLDAGLPILRSLQILEQQQKPGLLKSIVGQVASDVETGSSLSDAMSRHPKAFDKLYVNMVAAGEVGGVIDLILNRLADFMEKSQKLKKKVIGAMIYPIVVICIAVGIVGMIMTVVIPKFVPIFKDFKLDLPDVTKLLLAISHWFAVQFGWAIVLFSPVAIIMILKLIRTTEGGRYFADVVTLKIPIVGAIVSKSVIARFTRTLGVLISAGVSILEALNITRETSGNEVYARALGKVHDAVREGESVAETLRATKTVDSIVVNMVDVGEETGEIDKMLLKVADNYDADVDVLVSSLVSVLEPIMVIVLGGIVGFIVVALFMPMVSLIGGMSR